MSLNNIHIIIFLVVIIIISFIYNYDIHVTPKGGKLCEDVLIDKKDINTITKQNEIKIEDIKQNNVINNVMKVLEQIPSNIEQENIQVIVGKINSLYQSSTNTEDFNNKLKELPDEYPYNTKYAKLVINLIIKFDNDYNININKKPNIEEPVKEPYISIKKSKKKNKKRVSFDDSQNTLKIIENPIKTSYVEIKTLDNIGEFNNYAPF